MGFLPEGSAMPCNPIRSGAFRAGRSARHPRGRRETESPKSDPLPQHTAHQTPLTAVLRSMRPLFPWCTQGGSCGRTLECAPGTLALLQYARPHPRGPASPCQGRVHQARWLPMTASLCATHPLPIMKVYICLGAAAQCRRSYSSSSFHGAEPTMGMVVDMVHPDWRRDERLCMAGSDHADARQSPYATVLIMPSERCVERQKR